MENNEKLIKVATGVFVCQATLKRQEAQWTDLMKEAERNGIISTGAAGWVTWIHPQLQVENGNYYRIQFTCGQLSRNIIETEGSVIEGAIEVKHYFHDHNRAFVQPETIARQVTRYEQLIKQGREIGVLVADDKKSAILVHPRAQVREGKYYKTQVATNNEYNLVIK